jgi:hypothetical protein
MGCYLFDRAVLLVHVWPCSKLSGELGAHEQIVGNRTGLAVATDYENSLKLRPLKLDLLDKRRHVLVGVVQQDIGVQF